MHNKQFSASESIWLSHYKDKQRRNCGIFGKTDKCHFNCLYISIKYLSFETWQDNINRAIISLCAGKQNVQITAAILIDLYHIQGNEMKTTYNTFTYLLHLCANNTVWQKLIVNLLDQRVACLRDLVMFFLIVGGNLLQTYYSSAASFVLPGKCFTLFSDLSKFTPELLKTGSVVLPLVFELTLRCENGE